jgi:hypothetical protein
MILTVNNRIQICIIVNFGLLMIIGCFVFNFADSNMLRIGFSKDLIVMGIVIDSLEKYLILHLCIFFIEFCHSIIYEYANPIMFFNVFNDDKKIITDFGQIELQLYAQSLWFLTTIKNGLMILVAITQIDITICKIVYSEIAIAIVIYNKLKNKRFVKNIVDNDDVNLLSIQ